jgi:hypothetical protein
MTARRGACAHAHSLFSAGPEARPLSGPRDAARREPPGAAEARAYAAALPGGPLPGRWGSLIQWHIIKFDQLEMMSTFQICLLRHVHWAGPGVRRFVSPCGVCRLLADSRSSDQSSWS